MAAAGVDISSQESTFVTDQMLKDVGLVVTACGHADEQCPVLPPGVRRLHWRLSDPASASESEQEILRRFRDTRDEVESRIRALLQAFRNGEFL